MSTRRFAKLLALGGWQPDMGLAGQASYFSMSRIRGRVPGVTDT
jgi:hypothetical protein